MRPAAVSERSGVTLRPEWSGNASTLRGSLLMFVGRIMASGVGLITQMLLMRTLSKADYGDFGYALATAALIQSVLALGLDRADTRFLTLYHEEGDTGRVIGVVAAELLVVLGTGLGSLVTMAAYLGLSGGFGREAGVVLMVLLVTAPLAAMDAMVLNAFAVFARPTAVFFRRYVLDPGLRLSVVVVLLVFGLDVRNLAFGYLAAGLTASLLYLGLLARLLRAVVRDAGVPFGFRWPGRPLFAFALPLLAGAVMYAATTALPAQALKYLSTSDQIGELRAVQQIAQLMLIVPTAFATLFLPRAARQVARGEDAELREHYWATAVWVSVLAFPAAVAMIAFPAQVMTGVAGQKYADTAPGLAILGVAFYTNAVLGLNGSLLQISGRVRQLMWSNVAGLVAVVVGSLVLVPELGSTGALIAVALGVAVPQATKHWSLRGLPVGMSHSSSRRLWAGATTLVLGCTALNLVLRPAVVPAAVLSVLAWGVLLYLMRHHLDAEEVLPVLGGLRGRRRAGAGAGRRKGMVTGVTEGIPASGASGPGLTDDAAATEASVTDGPGSWACLDWRFLLPLPDLGAVWVAADCPDEAAAAQALGLRLLAEGEPEPVDTVIARGATADLPALVARLAGSCPNGSGGNGSGGNGSGGPAGGGDGPARTGLVKLTVTGRPPRAGLFGLFRPWQTWRRRLRAAGLDVVVEAVALPNAQRATTLVDLAQLPALRLALRRQPASRKGRLLGRVAQLAVRLGLRQLVCRQGMVVATVQASGAR
jgi:O-antigen/teichoic acid export membrane protein